MTSSCSISGEVGLETNGLHAKLCHAVQRNTDKRQVRGRLRVKETVVPIAVRTEAEAPAFPLP